MWTLPRKLQFTSGERGLLNLHEGEPQGNELEGVAARRQEGDGEGRGSEVGWLV